MHGSTKGHVLFAAAAAEALGLPGSSHDWAHGGASGAAVVAHPVDSQALWTHNMLMPYLWWHLRGRSRRRPRARRPARAGLG